MEFRLRDRARTPKDLDFATQPRDAVSRDGSAIRDLLIDALAIDTDGDMFVFQVSVPKELTADTAGRGGWRFSVGARLAGKPFTSVRVDVVVRGEEISATERLPVPNTLEFAGMPTHDIEAVDRRQHFAEKLHALIRDYGDRPNTRVKDLLDLVLLIESGLSADASLTEVVAHVFSVRATHDVPEVIVDPPREWADTYPPAGCRVDRCASSARCGSGTGP